MTEVLAPADLEALEDTTDAEFFMHAEMRTLYHEANEDTMLKADMEIIDKEKDTKRLLRLSYPPESNVQLAWGTVILMAVCYSVYFIPVQIALRLEYNAGDFFVECIFYLDIFLSFVKPFSNMYGITIYNPKIISLRYLKSWFIFDICCSLPLYAIEGYQDKYTWRCIRIIRILKWLVCGHWTSVWILTLSIRYAINRLLKLVVAILTVAHFGGCLWYYFGDATREGLTDLEREQVWTSRTWPDDPILDHSKLYRYLVSMYWAFTTLSTVGYGDITPRSTNEILLTIVIMLSGTVFFAYTTGSIASMINSLDQTATYMQSRFVTLNSFMQSTNLPRKLKNRLTHQMGQRWLAELSNEDFKWSEVQGKISPVLQADIAQVLFANLIGDSKFLQQLKARYPVYLRELVSSFQAEQFEPGQRIFTTNSKWCVVNSGVVVAKSKVYPSLVYRRFTYGETVGDCGIFRADMPQRATFQFSTFVATEKVTWANATPPLCQLLTISAEKLMGIICRLNSPVNVDAVSEHDGHSEPPQHQQVDLTPTGELTIETQRLINELPSTLKELREYRFLDDHKEKRKANLVIEFMRQRAQVRHAIFMKMDMLFEQKLQNLKTQWNESKIMPLEKNQWHSEHPMKPHLSKTPAMIRQGSTPLLQQKPVKAVASLTSLKEGRKPEVEMPPVAATGPVVDEKETGEDERLLFSVSTANLSTLAKQSDAPPPPPPFPPLTIMNGAHDGKLNVSYRDLSVAEQQLVLLQRLVLQQEAIMERLDRLEQSSV